FYRKLIQRLSSSHRVVAPDHIGCGLSDKPQDWGYRLEDHIQKLEQLVLELDLRNITLVVHDWGGAIGCGFATRHAQRIARVFVMNTAAFPGGRIPRRIQVCRTPFVGEYAVRGLNAFARAAIDMAVESTEGMPAKVRRGFLAPYDSWAHRIAVFRFVMDIPLEPSHPSYATLEAIDKQLQRLASKPMRIAWGEKDWCFTPAFREMWEQRFPAAETMAIEDAGHYLLEDAHERVLPWLEEWLTRS
ncbi:MAG: pimeloyl-ACP methyl ester carboxylesterase, partial [Candidatus Paceibacteria bacterium]